MGLGAAAFAPGGVELAPGLELPWVNLGGISSMPSNYTEFIKLGGQGLDTALTYGNAVQRTLGEAVAASPVPRDQLFVTNKVPCCPSPFGAEFFGDDPCLDSRYNGTVAESVAYDISLTGSVDLMILHWPCTTIEQTLEAYEQLEVALANGQTKAIGVSNFNVSVLKEVLPRMKTKPVVNQCQHSIGAHNSSNLPLYGGGDVTAAFCQAAGIRYVAYSPLGGIDGLNVLSNPVVKGVAATHNVSAAQVALRWLVQQEIPFVTSAVSPEYIAQDLDLFGFELSGQEMVLLGSL